jgi:hypothetical protein
LEQSPGATVVLSKFDVDFVATSENVSAALGNNS